MLAVDFVFVAFILLSVFNHFRDNSLGRRLPIYYYVMFFSGLLFVSCYLCLRLEISQASVDLSFNETGNFIQSQQ